MAKELTYTITALEQEGANLHVSVAWEVIDGEAREVVLNDTLAMKHDAPREAIEKAIELRAESYVRPRYIDPPPAPRADLAALIGREKRIERKPETRPPGGKR